MQVGITVELLGSWQLLFQPGSYIARVAGGNLIGGPGGDPIAYSEGVQTLLIQSAASTVVTTSGSIPSSEQNANAVIAAMNTNPPKVNVAKVNDYPVDGEGTDLNPWGPA